MKKINLFFALLLSMGLFAQEDLTLEECYQLINTNYPLAKQSNLLEKQNTFELDAIRTQKLPQLDVSMQATYQSDVIEIPVPNVNI